MRAKLRELWETPFYLHAHYGDVIGVHRAGGLYDHYGVYANDECIYEYGMDKNGKLSIHTTTLEEFTHSTGSYFILEFPKSYGSPGKIEIGPPTLNVNALNKEGMAEVVVNSLKAQRIPAQYRLYSAWDTITRAKSRVGEEEYNLVLGNCEHYAIWCKTGLSDSHQVESILGVFAQKHR